MRIVIALGGNALLRRFEPLTENAQQHNVAIAARSIASIAQGNQVVVTHGNGPQVGLLALVHQAGEAGPSFGLDVLGAESQGMIGFLLEQALRNEMPGRTVATLLTSVLVDAGDPAFASPVKPIGPLYGESEAQRLVEANDWRMTRAAGGFRRVVPSPAPLAILELEAIRVLMEAGVLVICGGGGGVPVIHRPDGVLQGVEGVVDKDLTSALLAEAIASDRLLLLTDVRAVEEDWGSYNARQIHETTPAYLRRLSFEAGSMAPKVEAACRFVERTGGTAAIGALADAPQILAEQRGTIIRPGQA